MSRAGLVLLLVVGVVVFGAAPAGAHGVGGREPTNIRVRVLDVEPDIDGVSVGMADFGTKIEVRNTSDVDVVVLGYSGEPYLRVGPDGAFENARSPAVFLNQSFDPPPVIPEQYDKDAEPEWRKIGSGDSVKWHDHRAHWMNSGTPPELESWTVELEVGGTPVTVLGDISTETAPPWWPWFIAVAAIAAIVVAVARRWWRATALVALVVLLVCELLHVVGTWRDIASTTDDRLGAQALSVLALVGGIIALVRVARGSAYQAAPWALLAAVVFGVVGAGDILVWTRSQLPSMFAAPFVRAVLACTLGTALGLIIASAARLRAPAVPAEEVRL